LSGVRITPSVDGLLETLILRVLVVSTGDGSDRRMEV
jgi:hypothetical protein